MEYTHRTNPRSRSISVRLDHAGNVIVTSPRFTPRWVIQHALKNADNWIKQHRAVLQRRRSIVLGDETERKILYRGVPYPVQILSKGDPGVTVRSGMLYIHPVSETDTSIQRALERWLRSSAEKRIADRVSFFSKRMDVKYKSLGFRTQKTRWGSCSSSGNLSMHWRLIQAPDAVSDYVVIHELAHIREMNHSRRFWELVRRHDPEYAVHRAWLQRHGSILQEPLWDSG